MKRKKEPQGLKVHRDPLASSAKIVELLLKKDYSAAEAVAIEERKKASQAAERYVASLVAAAPR